MKTQTQDQQVLEWILTGTPITQLDANFRLGVSRLAAIIDRLEKRKGWRGYFRHERIEVKNRFGQNVSCVRYRL